MDTCKSIGKLDSWRTRDIYFSFVFQYQEEKVVLHETLVLWRDLMKKISNLSVNSGVLVQGELMGKLDVRTDIQNECICLTFERDKHGNEAVIELSQNDFFALRKVVDSFEASVFAE